MWKMENTLRYVATRAKAHERVRYGRVNIENSLSDVATRAKAHERVQNGLVLENYEAIWV
jgi:hypothetical protein